MENFEKSIKLHNLNQQLKVETEFDASFEKALGEGSRGGKVIGHTKSGKPIYDTFEHEGHKDFNAQDHKDAADKHHEISRESDAHKLHFTTQKHRNERQKHFNEHTDKLNTLTKEQSAENEKISHPTITASSAHGDMQYSSMETVQSAVKHLTKPENYSVLKTNKGFMVTTNKRASQFVKQGEGKLHAHVLPASPKGFDRTPSVHIIKAEGDEFEKSRSGIYKPTKENLKHGRAGERFGNMVNGGSTQDLESGKGKNKFKVGDKIKVEKHAGMFESAKVTGVRGDMVSYTTSSGDFGNVKYDSNTIQKSINSELETIYKAFEDGILSKDVFEKGKKGQIGETRTWHGVQMKKVSESGDSKKDWQPIKQGEGKSSADKPAEGGEGKMSEEALSEHAKQSSEQALTNAIKSSPDPTVRQVAHTELQRRKKEESPSDGKGEFPSKEFMGGGDKKDNKPKLKGDQIQTEGQKKMREDDNKHEKGKITEYQNKKDKGESDAAKGEREAKAAKEKLFDLAAKVYDKLDFKDIQNEKKIASALKELGYPNNALYVGIMKRHLKEGSEIKKDAEVKKSIQGIRYF
jgi:hypothetical protein